MTARRRPAKARPMLAAPHSPARPASVAAGPTQAQRPERCPGQCSFLLLLRIKPRWPRATRSGRPRCSAPPSATATDDGPSAATPRPHPAQGASGALLPLSFTLEHSPADTDSHTYAVRVGPGTAGAVRLNGTLSGRLFGGAATAQLTVEEIKG